MSNAVTEEGVARNYIARAMERDEETGDIGTKLSALTNAVVALCHVGIAIKYTLEARHRG